MTVLTSTDSLKLHFCLPLVLTLMDIFFGYASRSNASGIAEERHVLFFYSTCIFAIQHRTTSLYSKTIWLGNNPNCLML